MSSDGENEDGTQRKERTANASAPSGILSHLKFRSNWSPGEGQDHGDGTEYGEYDNIINDTKSPLDEHGVYDDEVGHLDQVVRDNIVSDTAIPVAESGVYDDDVEYGHCDVTNIPMDDTDETAGVHAETVHQPTRAHVAQPGAFRVGNNETGVDSCDDDVYTWDESVPTSAHSVAPQGNIPVTARVVDPAEEEQKVQELVDLKVEQRLRSSVVANVLPERFSRQTKRRMIVGAAVLSAIALGVGLGVALWPPRPPMPPTEEELADFLSLASSDDGAALLTNSTPQNQAFMWLVNNNTRLAYYTKERIKQRYALATLYYSTDGDNWTKADSWLDDEDECNRWWQTAGPLDCSPESGEVVTLEFRRNNLVGRLPPEIGFLTSLIGLELPTNAIHGSLPTELAALSRLEVLDLLANSLSGPLPTEITNMTSLVRLDLSQNLLTGTITSLVGRLTALERLSLSKNTYLNGTIPTEIAKLTNLKTLNAHTNRISGSIPDVMGNLTNMETINLYDNMISGKIPFEIMEMTRLKLLHLKSNRITGGITTRIGRLTNLKQLFVYDNEMNGTIPSEIQYMTDLLILQLRSNRFTGGIPSEIGLLTQLMEVHAWDNMLSGRFPEEITELTSLTSLNVKGNQLTGSLSTRIGRLSLLEGLPVYDNELGGSLPSELGLLTQLTALNVRENEFLGGIPDEIFSMSSLESLALGSNGFEGTIPTTVGALSNMIGLSMSNLPQITGTLPSEIGLLTVAQGLEFQECRLFGTIPSEVHTLRGLVRFKAYGNNLTGPFTCPESIADCFVSCDDGHDELCRTLP